MNDAPKDSNKSAGGKPDAAPAVRATSVAKIVLPVALLMAAGLVYFGFFDGWQKIVRFFRPPLVPVTGEVMYQGKPLPGGQVLTQPNRQGLRGSIGFITDGKFSLQMDIDGQYVDGAYACEHKVTVADYALQRGPSPPVLRTPPRYAKFSTTPLVMTVSKNEAENKWTIVLEDAPADASEETGESSGEAGPPPRGAGTQSGGPPISAGMIMGTRDTNEDGKLDAAELEAAPQRLKDMLQNADLNSDGAIDREELDAAISAASSADAANPSAPAESGAKEAVAQEPVTPP
jgi:hypothetical protein